MQPLVEKVVVVVEFVDPMPHPLTGLLKTTGMESCPYVESNIESDVLGSGICFISASEGL